MLKTLMAGVLAVAAMAMLSVTGAEAHPRHYHHRHWQQHHHRHWQHHHWRHHHHHWRHHRHWR